MNQLSQAATRDPKARSLHIGLNAVDPAHYQGWSGELAACEYDALDLRAIAESQGIEAKNLHTTAATRGSVLFELRKAAKELHPGDLFFLSYSGHGGQVPDASGDESDGRDETWCLYDGQLIDDELYAELARFVGVRILVLSDSCHSGTVVRAMAIPDVGGAHRKMPPGVAARTYEENRELYDGLQHGISEAAGAPVDPDAVLAGVASSPRRVAIYTKFTSRVLLISGCQDNQTSMDGLRNGAFTDALKRVWDGGSFRGTYAQFHARIVSRMPPSQTPNLYAIRAASFLRERPFQV